MLEGLVAMVISLAAGFAVKLRFFSNNPARKTQSMVIAAIIYAVARVISMYMGLNDMVEVSAGVYAIFVAGFAVIGFGGASALLESRWLCSKKNETKDIVNPETVKMKNANDEVHPDSPDNPKPVIVVDKDQGRPKLHKTPIDKKERRPIPKTIVAVIVVCLTSLLITAGVLYDHAQERKCGLVKAAASMTYGSIKAEFLVTENGYQHLPVCRQWYNAVLSDITKCAK